MPKLGSYQPKIRPKLYLMCSLYLPILYVTHGQPGLPMGILFHLTKFISSTGKSNVGKTALASRFVRGQVIPPSTIGGEKFSFKWVIIVQTTIYAPKVKQTTFLTFNLKTIQRNLTSRIFLSSSILIAVSEFYR